jgi:hypothetical protein
MDNPETLNIVQTRYKTKTNKTQHNTENKNDDQHRVQLLKQELFKQGYVAPMLKLSLQICYGCHHALFDRYEISISQMTMGLLLLSTTITWVVKFKLHTSVMLIIFGFDLLTLGSSLHTIDQNKVIFIIYIFLVP